MKKFHGTGVSDGYAIGALCYISRDAGNTTKYDPAGYEAASSNEEQERFETAQKEVIEFLSAQSERLLKQGQETASDLMNAHAQLADDPDFTGEVTIRILDEAKSAPAAVLEVAEDIACMFEEMEGTSMEARAADIRDVAVRIAKQIKKDAAGKDANADKGTDTECNGDTADQTGLCDGHQDARYILGARDLTPSEAVMCDRSKVQAIVLAGGSAYGHTAIVARSYGIPAVIGVGAEFADLMDPETDIQVIVDGYSGDVIIDPDEDTIARYKKLIGEREKSLTNKQEDTLNEEERLQLLRNGKIKFYCNIQTPDEVTEVLKRGGQGIGLFRSEFLFLGRGSAPAEDEQFESYRKVLTEMNGREVIIRTLDIGADKSVPYIEPDSGNDSALGLRGLRLCLRETDIFRTQLRALYRASAYGNLKIMFPMVTSLWEVVKAKEICREVTEELQKENADLRDVPIGIMIETPAAALESGELAKEVDFFSIGTNDLTQYALACDRNSSGANELYDQKHPSVLKLIETTIRGAHENGIEVGICGELAADTTMTGKLIDMGVDELSVAPGMLGALAGAIREMQ